MIIRKGSGASRPTSPLPAPRLFEVEPLQSPSMPVCVCVDMDTVGACETLKRVCAPLRGVEFHGVAAHASQHRKRATVVTPCSTRSAALDHILLLVGLWVGASRSLCRGLWCWWDGGHVIVVTRDHERGSTVKALFLYDGATRRFGATYTHATSEQEAIECLRDATLRRGCVAAVCCAAIRSISCLGGAAAFATRSAYGRLRERRAEAPAPDPEASSPLVVA